MSSDPEEIVLDKAFRGENNERTQVICPSVARFRKRNSCTRNSVLTHDCGDCGGPAGSVGAYGPAPDTMSPRRTARRGDNSQGWSR